MLSIPENDQADVIEAFNSTSQYLDDFLNIDNHYFDQMVSKIIPLNLGKKKNILKPFFFILDLSINNGHSFI